MLGLIAFIFFVSVASFSHEISNGSNVLNMVGACWILPHMPLFVSKKFAITITMTCPAKKMGGVLISNIYIYISTSRLEPN